MSCPRSSCSPNHVLLEELCIHLRQRAVASAHMCLVCVLADSQAACLAWGEWSTSTEEHSLVRP
jgi:hypothetical protein